MIISIIAALSDEGIIGRDNDLPWHMPADLKRFKRITAHKPVLMGRKTWESIGRALPDRKNIVVSRTADLVAEGAVVVSSIVEALAEAEGAEEIMVIGGADLYEQLLPRADRMYLTYVHGRVEGDARFPVFNTAEWKEKCREKHEADATHAFGYTFVRLDRVRPG